MKSSELGEHLFGAVLGTLDVLTVHIGARFGLYDLLARSPLTVGETAEASGMAPRYCREWLEQQTVAGFLEVDDAAAAAEQRRYFLPAEHATVLCDRESLEYFAPFADVLAAAAVKLPALLEAYRTGGGVAWHEYGETMRLGQAEANRPLFLQVLGNEWLPQLSDVHTALAKGGRVADIGCGDGWSSIGMGTAYPDATIVGFDLDPASIAAATDNAGSYGLADRVRFEHADVAALTEHVGAYDLVTAFECVHDMSDPVGVLSAARRLVAPGGTVLVMDERVPEEFTGPGDPIEQFMYGFSLLVCLPDGMSHPDSAGTGTVMRPSVLRGYARAAGFGDIEVLDIDHDMFRLYRLVE
ncbi:class I SAM-dependent methyltransferase [Nocardia lasii]|uniref:Class I SAM-dependent methyltransferase n=1 Tax=Nocardia lasii TaxID=1616107 RepID=A0ABW1JLY9_9NOCA